MIHKKRFGRAVGLPSTVQIVRELMVAVHRDAEAAAATASERNAAGIASGGPSSLDAR